MSEHIADAVKLTKMTKKNIPRLLKYIIRYLNYSITSCRTKEISVFLTTTLNYSVNETLASDKLYKPYLLLLLFC